MEINYIGVLIAGVVAWAIGALWYSPLLFSNAWQTEAGLSDEEVQGGNMALIFGSSFVLMVIMALGLSFILGAHETMNWKHGAFHGLMAGLFFSITTMGINYLYQRKSLKLYLIDAVYLLLFITVEGAILGYFYS